MTSIKELFIEVHEKDDSFMNQRWNWDSLFIVNSNKWLLRNYKVKNSKKVDNFLDIQFSFHFRQQLNKK